MKRILAFVVCLVLLFMAAIPASAAEASVGKGTLIYRTEQTLENGLTFVDELYEIASTRATDKTSYKTRNVYYGDTLVGTITIQATFRYDGSAVSVVSKSVTQSTTYDGWSYKQNSFTSSGGTVILDAKLTKLLILTISVDMTLTCDKNGNVS